MLCEYCQYFLVYPEQVAPLWIDKNEKLAKLLQNISFLTPKNWGPRVRTEKWIIKKCRSSEIDPFLDTETFTLNLRLSFVMHT